MAPLSVPLKLELMVSLKYMKTTFLSASHNSNSPLMVLMFLIGRIHTDIQWKIIIISSSSSSLLYFFILLHFLLPSSSSLLLLLIPSYDNLSTSKENSSKLKVANIFIELIIKWSRCSLQLAKIIFCSAIVGLSSSTRLAVSLPVVHWKL